MISCLDLKNDAVDGLTYERIWTENPSKYSLSQGSVQMDRRDSNVAAHAYLVGFTMFTSS